MRSLVSLTAFALSAALAMPAAYAQLIKSDQKLDNNEAAAMKSLAQTSLVEIESGKIAAAKAQRPDVKQFAQKMTNDHSRMLADLRTLAKAKGVALPDALSLKDLADRKKLERHSGADFDRHFLEDMVKDHQGALKEAQDIAAKAKDPDFKAAMQRASSTIRENLLLAQRLATEPGAATGGTRTWPVTPSPSTPSSGTPSGAGEINPRINYSK
jgi:putative membrane protein